MQINELIEKLNNIYKSFDFESQVEKLNEECDELCSAFFAEDWHWTNEEIADVFIVSAQLVLNNPEIEKNVIEKIERTLIRIKENYYKKSDD